MAFIDFLIEVEDVKRVTSDPTSEIRLLDGTWSMPGQNGPHEGVTIPGAVFFDLDEIATQHPSLNHMLPSSSQFETFNREHGINNTDHIVCYDRHGVFSSPRLWWTYRMFGHEKVSVLNGGLPEWMAKKLPVSQNVSSPKAHSDYSAKPPLSGVIGFEELKALIGGRTQIIDARPAGRFDGTAPEPRAGLKAGHMPGAISLPFSELKAGTAFKTIAEISKLVGRHGIDLEKPIVTTCGSGITAAGLALLFHQLGAKDVRVYDASWAEWGASSAPIES